MKYIIEVSDEEMKKVKNSHKALFIDVYGMMTNIIKNGIPLDNEYERIVQEIGYRVMEDKEKFVIKAITPYTEDIIQGTISKEELEQIIIRGSSLRWCNVKDTLPEKNGIYIVSYEDSVRLLEWFNGKWFFYPSNPAREETGTIAAWMPLPQPYKVEREDINAPTTDCVSRKEVMQSKPEWLDENVERETPEQTLIDRAYNKGWNKCLQVFLDNIKQLPSVEPATK